MQGLHTEIETKLVDSIVGLIRLYHQEYDPFDGDSAFLFEDVSLMLRVRDAIKLDAWLGKHWTLYTNESDFIIFSDMSNENCILTINKKAI